MSDKPIVDSVGRPTVVTDEVLRKLRDAFLIGCTDAEACLYANIAPSTLYKYQAEHPDFSEEKEYLKQNPLLKARTTIFNNLDKLDMATWFVSRKAKKEFAQRNEITGGEGEPIGTIVTTPAQISSLLSALEDMAQSATKDDEVQKGGGK